MVSLNLRQDTLAASDSLLQAGALPEQIVVVDNGSTDGTVAEIDHKYGQAITIIANPDNVGLSLAYDQGAEWAFQRGADWVLLINNDTEVAPDFFKAVEDAWQRPELPVVSPRSHVLLRYRYNMAYGFKANPGTLIWRDHFKGKAYSTEWPDLLPMDCISSCAMIVKREVYEKVGLFEPKFIIYWDEVDFCWRAHLAGYRMAAMTKARVWHKVSKTMKSGQAASSLSLHSKSTLFLSQICTWFAAPPDDCILGLQIGAHFSARSKQRTAQPVKAVDGGLARRLARLLTPQPRIHMDINLLQSFRRSRRHIL